MTAGNDEFLQLLGVHSRHPRHDPTSEWKGMPVDRINILAEMNCEVPLTPQGRWKTSAPLGSQLRSHREVSKL